MAKSHSTGYIKNCSRIGRTFGLRRQCARSKCVPVMFRVFVVRPGQSPAFLPHPLANNVNEGLSHVLCCVAVVHLPNAPDVTFTKRQGDKLSVSRLTLINMLSPCLVLSNFLLQGHAL